jgi:hypothetical protein
MISLTRAFVFGLVAVLSGVLGTGLADVSAQAKDPRVGDWKLNVEKSKYSPGPAPQSQTLKIEAVGQGEKVTSEAIAKDGTKTTTVYTANFDGKDSPITGAPNSETVTLKRLDARTTERTDKKGGKVTQVLKRVVSEDGKTMTVTVKGTNAKGETIDNVVVFEKQ